MLGNSKNHNGTLRPLPADSCSGVHCIRRWREMDKRAPLEQRGHGLPATEPRPAGLGPGPGRVWDLGRRGSVSQEDSRHRESRCESLLVEHQESNAGAESHHSTRSSIRERSV